MIKSFLACSAGLAFLTSCSSNAYDIKVRYKNVDTSVCQNAKIDDVIFSDPKVVLFFDMDRDATIKRVRYDEQRYEDEPTYRLIADFGMNIFNGIPITGLPSNDYSNWKTVKTTVDPEECFDAIVNEQMQLNDAKARVKNNQNEPISLREKDYISNQIYKSWLALAGKIEDIIVIKLKVKIRRDGYILAIKDITDYKEGESIDNPYKVNAIRAVQKSNPIKGLPPEKYESWKELEIIFDPETVLGK